MSDRDCSAQELAIMADDLLRQLAGGPAFTPEEHEAALVARLERDGIDAARRARDEAALREDRQRRLRREYETKVSALPPKLRSMVLNEEATANAEWPAAASALAWLEHGKGRLLLIRGGVGVGKSAAAAMVASVVAFGGKGFSWHRPKDFVSAMLHDYDVKSPKLGTDLVVVDDLGRRSETEGDFEEALCTFLDDREQRMVMTTNLTKEDFRARYGSRVVDRLLEVGHAISIRGESRRKHTGDF